MPRPKLPPILNDKLVEVMTKGGLAPVVLGGFDHDLAYTLRHRLYRERIKMRMTNHPDAEIANKATISLQEDPTKPGSWRLIIYPINLLIETALENAGITTDDPPPLD